MNADDGPGRKPGESRESVYGKAAIGVLVLFAMGLVGYFAFSAGHGDGLEVTMEEAGEEEGEQVYSSPLDYGDDYPSAFLAGIIGFGICAVVVRLTGRFASSRGPTGGDDERAIRHK